MDEVTSNRQYCAMYVNMNMYTIFFVQMDLVTFITKSECECLNESDDHPLAHALNNGSGYLASDCDEQLIINITFNQVRFYSLLIYKFRLLIL